MMESAMVNKEKAEKREALVLLGLLVGMVLAVLWAEAVCLGLQKQVGELQLQIQVQRQFLDDLGFKQAGWPKHGRSR
jgi:hypothetical protein